MSERSLVRYDGLERALLSLGKEKAGQVAESLGVSGEYKRFLDVSRNGDPYRSEPEYGRALVQAVTARYSGLEQRVENEVASSVGVAKSTEIFAYVASGVKVIAKDFYGLCKRVLTSFLPGKVQKWMDEENDQKGWKRRLNNIGSLVFDCSAGAGIGYLSTVSPWPFYDRIAFGAFIGFLISGFARGTGYTPLGPFTYQGTFGPLVSEIVYYTTVYPLYLLGKVIGKGVQSKLEEIKVGAQKSIEAKKQLLLESASDEQ